MTASQQTAEVIAQSVTAAKEALLVMEQKREELSAAMDTAEEAFEDAKDSWAEAMTDVGKAEARVKALLTPTRYRV